MIGYMNANKIKQTRIRSRPNLMKKSWAKVKCVKQRVNVNNLLYVFAFGTEKTGCYVYVTYNLF